MEGHPTLALVLVAVLGVLAQWVAWRIRIPAIILLLGAGLLAGPLTGFVRPTEDFGRLLGPVVGLSVALILFEGGLSLRWYELRTAARGVRRLVFPAVPIAWGLGTLAAHFVGGISWPVSLLLGAILVVTGPTVILPLLRHARLKRRPASYLKWEGILNDPIGALLAVLVFQYFSHTGEGTATGDLLLGVLLTAAMAAVLGIGGGFVLGAALRRGFVPEYLKAPVLLASALLVTEAANLVQHEAGLAAATVLGIVLGNRRLPSMEEIRRFKEYVAVLLVSAVFVLLTAGLDPALLLELSARNWLLLVALLVVVRPATVLVSTIGAGMELPERLLVAWIAPRGIVAAAVAAAFAPALVEHGYGDARLLVPLVFSFVFLTVTLHGLTIGWLGRRLGLAAGGRSGVLLVGGSPFSVELARELVAGGVPVLLADSSWHRLRPARMAGIPVRFGEIVSERSEETLDAAELSVLLALTSSDAYNALVCTRFASEFGRDRVFQLPLLDSKEDDPRGLHHALRGSIAFGPGARYEDLVSRHYRGWEIRRTKITEAYRDEQARLGAGEESIRLLLVRDSGEVAIETERAPVAPAPGDVLLTLAPPAPTPPPPVPD